MTYREQENYFRKNNIGFIYKITSPSGKIYIGQTVNILSRYSHYKGLHCKDQPAIYNSLLKYGMGKHTLEILYKGPNEMLNYIEHVYIKYYDSMNNGLNCKLGGNQFPISEESRLKIIQSNKGRKRTEETRNKMSKSKIGTCYKKGAKLTKEQKNNIAKAKIGKSTGTGFKISATSKDGLEILIFNSMYEASLYFKGDTKHVSTISEGFKYNRNTYGYIWKKLNNNESKN